MISSGTKGGGARRGPYPHLLSPLKIGGATLANRGVMGAMHTRIETLDNAAQRLRAFYRARAEGEIGLILTGGISPNREGRIEDDAPVLDRSSPTWIHDAIISAVNGTDTKICMQILHAGRYAKHADCVGPSAAKARINKFQPRMLSTAEIWRTIDDFAEAAAFARELGYHGVEIMGSEGYLINEFTAPRTNDRTDEFGGEVAGRMRLPVEIVRAVRRRVGQDFLLIYRISALDLVDGGMDGHETALLARQVAAAGVDMLNTGVGWHESQVPTVAYVVPRAGWAAATARIKAAVEVPVIASNRINDPQVADRLIADGTADLVSMARPLLADPDFMKKARLGRADIINTCIACNQACLDRIFVQESASCLVNPIAGHETEFPSPPVGHAKRIAVVGGGAAGMAFAMAAARRGHRIKLFEAATQLGGQLLMARAVPLKVEFDELLRYFRNSLDELGVEVSLGVPADAAMLQAEPFDEIVVATGVRPRHPDIAGIDHPKVLRYSDVLMHGAPVGERVAIIGAGGIAFDLAEYLLEPSHQPPVVETFNATYGIDPAAVVRGGLSPQAPAARPQRLITMLQRSPGRLGAGLGLSTGWIHKQRLARYGVEMVSGASYLKIDDAGLHVAIDGTPRTIAADSIVICAGQEPERSVYNEMSSIASVRPVHVIGGAERAAELDAMRAIDQGMRLAEVL